MNLLSIISFFLKEYIYISLTIFPLLCNAGKINGQLFKYQNYAILYHKTIYYMYYSVVETSFWYLNICEKPVDIW